MSATTTMSPYLARVGEVALLSAESEVDLAKRAAAGRVATSRLLHGPAAPPERTRLELIVRGGEAATDLLVRANLRLVLSMAGRYQGRGLDLPDLVQEGNLGLLKAVDRFDHTRGFRFSTYAAWWIRQTITRGLADRGRPVRLPVHAHELVVKLRWIELDLWQRFGVEPSEEELAEALGVRPQRLRDIRAAAADVTSLDAPVGGESGSPLSALLADPGADDPAGSAAVADAKRSLRAALQRLDERERSVLELRYGLLDGEARTLDDIGRLLGVTRERIRQIELRGLRKLAHRRLEPLLDDLSA